jgi:ketosteroid isomerase-like protein
MLDTQLILAANQDFYRAFEQQDLDAMATIWSKGTDCLCIHPGRPALRGWEQIRMAWEQIFQNTEMFRISTSIITAQVSGNLGYIVLVEQISQVIQGREVTIQSMGTNIFENMAGNWYLVHHHGSPIMPPAPRPGQQPG